MNDRFFGQADSVRGDVKKKLVLLGGGGVVRLTTTGGGGEGSPFCGGHHPKVQVFF